jgi:hypothetical protein
MWLRGGQFSDDGEVLCDPVEGRELRFRSYAVTRIVEDDVCRCMPYSRCRRVRLEVDTDPRPCRTCVDVGLSSAPPRGYPKLGKVSCR